jgi:hypothetical protein
LKQGQKVRRPPAASEDGPFKRDGVAVGVALQEVSDDVNLIASTGQPDATTAPTQNAVKSYVDQRAVPSGGDSRQILAKFSDMDYETEWKTLTKGDVGLANVADILQIGVVEKGQANGVATLDDDAVLAASQIPAALHLSTLNVSGTGEGARKKKLERKEYKQKRS